MRDTSLKAAIVGCGAIGSLYDEGRQGQDPHSHAGAYTTHPAVRLVAGADIDPVRRKELTQMWGVSAYADYQEMLTCERPDIVSICTWPDSHAAITMAAVEAGVRAVFCEKPLADSLANGYRIVDVCERTGTVLAVNHWRRWDPCHQQVRQFLLHGELGAIQHVSVHYVRGIANSGSHLIDLLRFFFGDIASMCAFNRLGEDGSDPTLDAYLTMQNGIGCSLAGCRPGDYDLFEVDIIGTTGRLVIGDLGSETHLWRAAPHRDFSTTRTLREVKADFPRGAQGTMVAAVENIVQSLTRGVPVLGSGQDAVKALEAIVLLKESARTSGKPCLGP